MLNIFHKKSKKTTPKQKTQNNQLTWLHKLICKSVILKEQRKTKLHDTCEDMTSETTRENTMHIHRQIYQCINKTLIMAYQYWKHLKNSGLFMLKLSLEPRKMARMKEEKIFKGLSLLFK